MKLLVVSRSVDATTIVTGSLAVLAGWALALTLRQRRIAAGLSGQERHQAPSPPQRVLGLLLLAWLAAALFLAWQPFDFMPNAPLTERLRHVPLVPFVDYYQGNYWNSFDQFVHKTLLFAPLGALVALTLRRASPRQTGILVVAAAAIVATVLEAGQLFLPTRYASITDIIVETGGAWVGQLAVVGLGRRRKQAPITNAQP
jgi:glycopeptide antibiotics resistance protein